MVLIGRALFAVMLVLAGARYVFLEAQQPPPDAAEPFQASSNAPKVGWILNSRTGMLKRCVPSGVTVSCTQVTGVTGGGNSYQVSAGSADDAWVVDSSRGIAFYCNTTRCIRVP